MTFGSLIPFSDVVVDATGGNAKIQRKEYLSAGLLPIIDQGQEDIAGYTDDAEAVYQGGLPVILFGDHTRAFKYVDTPFALGADGVKVLAPKPGFNAKFLYYYFQSCDIPSRGYSRHFKYLREISVPYFAPSEQQRIVELLDQADALRRLRRAADVKAARILPALFLKMFGDPATNPMGWAVRPLAQCADTNSGGTPDTKIESYYGGGIPWVKSGELSSRIINATEDTISEDGLRNSSAKWVEPGAILLAMYGATVGQVALLNIRATTNQAICAIKPKDGVATGYLIELLRLSKPVLLSMRVGGAQPNISQQIIRGLDVMLPPEPLQKEFSEQALLIEAVVTQASGAGKKIDDLFRRLLQKAFSGELTAKWRQAHMTDLLAEMQQQAKVLNFPMPQGIN